MKGSKVAGSALQHPGTGRQSPVKLPSSDPTDWWDTAVSNVGQVYEAPLGTRTYRVTLRALSPKVVEVAEHVSLNGAWVLRPEPTMRGREHSSRSSFKFLPQAVAQHAQLARTNPEILLSPPEKLAGAFGQPHDPARMQQNVEEQERRKRGLGTFAQIDYAETLLKGLQRRGLNPSDSPTKKQLLEMSRGDISVLIDGLKKKRGRPVFYGDGTFNGWQMPNGKFIKKANLQGIIQRVAQQYMAQNFAVPHSKAVVQVEPPRKKREKWPYQGFINFQGLQVHVENLRGSTRKGKDPDGTPWEIKMKHHYGEVANTKGVDHDPVDVYVGFNADSPLVVVVRQQDPKTKKYDEDKVMLGFDTEKEAIAAYKAQYNQPGFYQSHKAMPIGRFLRWCLDKTKQGKKVSRWVSGGSLPGSFV